MSTTSFGPTALATPANAITFTRLALTPVWLLVVVARGASWTSFALGFLLAVTDGVDGYVARRQGTTRSGAFLDPLADKFLVVGGLAALVVQATFWWLPVAVIAVREVGISVYRSWVSKRGVSIPASYWAKVKTVVQELAIGLALLPLTADRPVLARTVLWAGVVLAVATGLQYLYEGRKADRGAL